ncbi:MAG: hypothetical protein ACKV1O_24485 [Saprospiraceae bacterium]
MKKHISFLFFCCLLFNCNRNAVLPNNQIAAIEKKMYAQIVQVVKEIPSEVIDCLGNTKEELIRIYQLRISEFPLKEMVAEMGRLSDSLGLNSKKDTIILVLLNPYIGFDPQASHTTFFLIKSKKIISILSVSKNDKGFKSVWWTKEDEKDNLTQLQSFKTICGGNGYVMISWLDYKLKPLKCYVGIRFDYFSIPDP